MADSLQRAHQLSAQASILVRRPDADRSALDRALNAYREAAGLFDTAAQGADDSNRGTLKMLSNQHTRLVRDTERRIATLDAPPNPFRPSSPKSPPSPSRPAPQRSSSTPAGPVGLVGSARASVPPFSMRPVEPRFVPTSPLYSSSSSSEPPDESYLLPGAIPDTGDPFARFWGMLENMMEEISFPRALTTAVTPSKGAGEGAKGKEKEKGEKKKEKEKGKGREESPSPSESFYVVPAEKKADKTPEELALENASLRASLDALAVHSHALEKDNRELKKRAEERDVTLRSMVLDVQKEARKARHQEVLRSQMIAPPVERESGHGGQVPLRKRIAELEEEVRAGNKKLEESRQENVKLNAQLNKFKEKWDKLKAKKEAKTKAREGGEGVKH